MKSARRLALEALHAADVAGTDASGAADVADERARDLVAAVSARRDEIDAIIRETAEHWTIERMPVVDRNALRLGVYEIVFGTEAPGPAINELVGLVKMLSTEDSGRFVNGVLGRVARERRVTH